MIKKFFASVSLSLLSLGSLAATEITSQKPSIVQLLPPLPSPLMVAPAIPDNFVMRDPSGYPTLDEWVYWGPKNVLEKFFKSDSTDLLEHALIRVKLSSNLKQDEMKKNDEIIAQFKQQFPDGFEYFETSWGPYPVQSMKVKMEGNTVYTAWVGLNSKGGEVLMFNLTYPTKVGSPTKEDSDLWINFIKNTKPLSDAEYNALGAPKKEPGEIILSNEPLIKIRTFKP